MSWVGLGASLFIELELYYHLFILVLAIKKMTKALPTFICLIKYRNLWGREDVDNFGMDVILIYYSHGALGKGVLLHEFSDELL